MEYSKALIEECKNCFKEENGVDLTDEKANEFLDSLGGLYLTFNKSCTQKDRVEHK